MNEPQRILVTGGAGFIGSFVCEKLIARGDEVVCIDNFCTGSRENIEHLLDSGRFSIHVQDVINPIQAEVSSIYNLACPASPTYYQQHPIETTRTSILGALNILELARSAGATVLQASTSEVYGDSLIHPQTESYWGHVNPIGPRACYDEGKRCAEALFFDFFRQHNVPIKIARIFNTYGPRMRATDGRVIPTFICQALTNRPITIFGDGNHTRSFCYVEDLVDGLIGFMGSNKGVVGPINLGTTEECTIGALAEQIIDLCASRSQVSVLPGSVDDPKRRRPDTSLAHSTLRWRPTVDLRCGLLKTIAYFDHVLSKDASVRRYLDEWGR